MIGYKRLKGAYPCLLPYSFLIKPQLPLSPERPQSLYSLYSLYFLHVSSLFPLLTPEMPCHNASHTHDWPRSGCLTISKCESKCGFCTSTKDYKPASALRKACFYSIAEYNGRADIYRSTS